MANAGTGRVAFQTLGCKLNQHETESIANGFRNAGYTIVPFGEEADAYVINTCTVTGKADRKSRNSVNRALRSMGLANLPTSVVVVTGCFVEASPQTYRNTPGLYLLDNRRKSAALEIVEAHRRGEIPNPERHGPDLFGFDTPSPVFRTRGTVKIQDGCSTACSYCIIPLVRGPALSRPAAEVEAAVLSNIERGYREVVLTGINMSRYNDAGLTFPGLLRRLLALPGEFRLRLSSLEPELLTEELIEMVQHPRFMPHLHLCLQSGSDSVLSRMGRGYTLAEFAGAVEAVRSVAPSFHFTTDIIVGFPGETEDEFQASMNAVRRLRFGHVHTFPYSPRSHTAAAGMPNQVPETLKTERAARLREVSAAGRLEYRRSLVGCTEELLVEQIAPVNGTHQARGYGRHYIPILLSIPAGSRAEPLVNTLYSVRLQELEPGPNPAFRAELAEDLPAEPGA